MRIIDHEYFNELIKAADNIKPRTKRELRFATSTTGINLNEWEELELVAISDRTDLKGVLLLQPDKDLFILPYESSKVSPDQTGRIQPIICDLCKTWQNGSNAGRITFCKDLRSNNSTTFLCCADLKCSDHVRTKTAASIKSRAHLRESLTDEQRAMRLRERLRALIRDMSLSPL